MSLKIKAKFMTMHMRRYTLTKILFIHNTAMWYRIPFFNFLSETYNIEFIFTHLYVSKEIYNVKISDKIPGLENVKYKVLRNYLGIAIGVIKESLGDYDVLVGGSYDTLPELIETLFYFIIAKIRGKKVVIWREDWEWKAKSFKKTLAMPLIKFILSISDAVLVPGIKHREYFISLGTSKDEIFLMPNVSNVTDTNEDFKKKDKLMEKFELRDKKVILYVGRLVKRKGVDYLIKAFSDLQDTMENVILIIIGDGEYRSELEELSESLGISNKINFIGQVKNEELPSFYLLCDICVIPSITYGIGDPWVFVLNEAMHFRKPIIATDAVGAAFDMIIDGKNGFIVPEKDAGAIYGAMKIILSDKNLEKSMGKESKRIINERFQHENMVNGFKRAIEFVTN